MSSLFSSPSTPAPAATPIPVPTKSADEVQREAAMTRQRLASAAGRGSTILTATRDTVQPAGGKTLLGAA